MIKLKGAYTALVTPFDHEGRIDFDGLETLVEKQIEGNITGLVPCGTTGEASTMSLDEQISVIEHVCKIAKGRVPVIAGTGSNDTKKTVEYTQRVSKIKGVDAALVVVPYYNKPNQKGLIHHFEAVARYGQLPVVMYNIPGRSVISMTLDTVIHLSKNTNIIGIKEATGDLVFATRILELAPDFALLSGDDFTTFPFLAIGGSGCISVVSNLLPNVMSLMVSSVLDNNDLNAGRVAHMKLQTLLRATVIEPNPVPTKAAANLLGWFGDTVRGPLVTCSDESIDVIQDALLSVNLIQSTDDDDA